MSATRVVVAEVRFTCLANSQGLSVRRLLITSNRNSKSNIFEQ